MTAGASSPWAPEIRMGSWEKHRKSIGKAWETHGKTMGKW